MHYCARLYFEAVLSLLKSELSQVNPRNGEWVCVFCGHSNEASGVLATQSIEVSTAIQD